MLHQHTASNQSGQQREVQFNASTQRLTYLLSTYYVSAIALGAGGRAKKQDKHPDVFHRAWNLMRVYRQLEHEQAVLIAYFQMCLLWLSPFT